MEIQNKSELSKALITLGALFFITGIPSIIILVTFPDALLTPISYLINSELAYSSFDHSYKPGQSGTYYNFFIHDKEDLFLELPVLSLILLSSCSIFLVLIPLAILNLKGKNRFKDVIAEFKYFIAIFACSIALFTFANKENTTFKNAITLNLMNSGEDLYFGSFLTISDNEHRTYWHAYNTNITPNHYIKTPNRNEFSPYRSYELTIKSEDSVYPDLKLSSSVAPYIRANNDSLLAITESEIVLFNTSNNQIKTLSDLVSDQFQPSSPLKIDYKNLRSVSITNSLGENTTIDTTKILSDQHVNASDIRRRNRDLSNKLKSLAPSLNKPEFIGFGSMNNYILSQNQVNKSSQTTLNAFDKSFKPKWDVTLNNTYQPQIRGTDHLYCEKYNVTEYNGIVSVRYNYSPWHICATEFYDVKTGQIVETYFP